MNARAEIAARYDATPYAAPDAKRRAADEELLMLLAARRDGASTRPLAEQTGLTDAWIRAVTCRVRAADEAESGEAVADLAPHYWPVKRGAGRPINRRKKRNVRAGW